MAFTNNKKTKMIAAVIADSMDYVKKSKSYLSESELKNKKYGRSYNVYIPDPGKVVDGLEADPSEVNEIEMTITLENKNTSCEIDAWNDLVDIESFRDEIAVPRGTKLAKSVQQSVIDATAFKAANAVVGEANLETLAMASAQLDEAEVAGTKVSFLAPTVAAKISAQALGKFIPDSIQKDIYGKSYLGEYATASQITLAGLPTIKASAASATITLVADGTNGFKPITSVTGGAKGEAYKAEGLKLVDVNGMESDQDYVIVVGENGEIPEIRITVEGKAHNNPNAWVAEGTESLTLTPMLESGKEYIVGVVREETALAFDTYKFSDLPGSENETVTVDGVSLKMSKYGDGNKMQSLVRLDVPFAAGIPDARRQCVVYIEK